MAYTSWQREYTLDKLERQLHAIQNQVQPGPAFAAKYPGRCAQCGGRTQPGEQIQKSAIGGYQHVACPEKKS